MPHNVPPAPETQNDECRGRNGRQKKLFVERFHFARLHRAHETAHEHSAPKKGDIHACFKLGQSRYALLPKKINNGTAQRNLSTDVHENGDHTQNHVRVFQGARAWFNLAFTDMGQAAEKEGRSENQENDTEREIGHPDRLGSMRAGLGEYWKMR